VAAGTGLVTRTLAARAGEVVASDYAEAMVKRLRDRIQDDRLQNVEVRQLDVYELDEPGQFDAVVAANVLHLLPELDGALSAMVGALRPGGRLIVPTYCHDETPLSQVASRVLGLFGFPGQRRLTMARLVAILEDRGLLLRQATVLPGLLPIGFVSASRP
jgi:2-polyprenyl-3-methyl-5-hydroxy-6-metoxy-1,4-benzoquinol methylase